MNFHKKLEKLECDDYRGLVALENEIIQDLDALNEDNFIDYYNKYSYYENKYKTLESTKFLLQAAYGQVNHMLNLIQS